MQRLVIHRQYRATRYRKGYGESREVNYDLAIKSDGILCYNILFTRIGYTITLQRRLRPIEMPSANDERYGFSIQFDANAVRVVFVIEV